jgi:ABC-2 type transport system permease protein
VFGAIGQPFIFWLLFGLGLGPAFRPAGSGQGPSYLEYFFPGSLVLILLFTAIFATISVIEDRREGFLQAVLVAPIPRWSMVLGKVLGGTCVALVQGLLFLTLGLTVGVSFTLPTLLAAVLLLFLIALGLTALGLVLAWRLDSTQGFHAVMSVLLLPMWLLSGAFFPVPPLAGDAPWTQRGLSLVMHANPLTYGVAALRRLLAEDLGTLASLPSAGACWTVTLGFAMLAFGWAWHTAGRRTTGDLL